MRLRLIGICFGCLLALTAHVAAQTATSGQIAGTVHDPSGAAVVGARIVLTSATGQTREAQSTREGYYRFSGIEPGEYSLHVTAKGFATYTAGGIQVGVTETADVSPQLQVGGATTYVQVTAEAPPVTTSTRKGCAARLAGKPAGNPGGSVTSPVAAHSAPRTKVIAKPGSCMAGTSWPSAV